MPTLDELGQKVKAKYPQYADIPDAELGAKVKAKYPDAYKDFTDSSFSRIEYLRKVAPKGDVAKQAATNLRGMALQKSEEEYQGDVNRATGRAVGMVASGVPAALAAPATGGMSLLPALGTMAGAGVAGGVLREGSEALIGGEKKSASELATNLGIDAVTGMVLEGGGRAVGGFVKGMIPKMIMKSGVRSELGAKVLQTAYANTSRDLFAAVGGKHVDITGDLLKAYDELITIPKGTGKVGQRFGQLSPKAQEVLSDIHGDLNIASGGIHAQQPLDGLIRIRGKLNQFAWKEAELDPLEAEAFQNLSGELNKTIKAATKTVSPEAAALYDKANGFMTIIKQKDIATTFAKRFIGYTARHMLYAGAGGYAGYRTGGATGAVVGAAAGASLDAVSPQVSGWILDQVMNNKGAAGLMKQAINAATAGKRGEATALSTRAFMQADVAPKLKEVLRDPSILTEQSPDQP